MKDLNHQLKALCRRNRDGSFGTQDGRRHMLDLMATQLHELGYRRMRATSLKPKHVNALVARWREQGISTGTLKNRFSVLRWWAGKVNRSSVIAADNSAYGIGARVLVSNESKAQTLDEAKLAKIEDEYACRPLSGYAGKRRSSSVRATPSAAITSRSKRAGPRAAGPEPSRSPIAISSACCVKSPSSPRAAR